ncbi:MAG: DUF4136 domain-containing protein [Marinoscillum sp.]
MKSVTTFLITTVLSFTLFAQEQEVETYSLDNLDDPKDYDSYAFLSQQNNPDLPGVLVEESSVITSEHENLLTVEYTTTGWENAFPEESDMIKESIGYELDLMDMDRDRQDPDVLIQYHIFNSDYIEDDQYINAVEDYKYVYTKKEDLLSKLDDGTVVMSVVDTDENKSVWEGFAYNAYDENDPLYEREKNIRQAVEALMEQFAIDHS